MPPEPYHTSRGRGSRAGPELRTPHPRIRVQEKGCGVGDYCTLKWKKAALSAGANSRQILPSTTDTDSEFTVKGREGIEVLGLEEVDLHLHVSCSIQPDGVIR